MKKTLIVTLACVNVALLGALVLGTATPTADAQVFGGGRDYLMLTANIGTDNDAVYIIDLATRRMLTWRYDRTNKRLAPFRGRDLTNDFRPAQQEEQQEGRRGGRR